MKKIRQQVAKGAIEDGASSPKAIISNCLRATAINGKAKGQRQNKEVSKLKHKKTLRTVFKQNP